MASWLVNPLGLADKLDVEDDAQEEVETVSQSEKSLLTRSAISHQGMGRLIFHVYQDMLYSLTLSAIVILSMLNVKALSLKLRF